MGQTQLASYVYPIKENEERFVKLIRADKNRMRILKLVSSYKNKELWISGGFVRNIVWNYASTDVDVYYYDKEDINKQTEKNIEEELRVKMRNLKFSVKNQARMHQVNKNENQYYSLRDGIAKQIETASAIAIRLENERMHFLVPYSHAFHDLYNRILRPTPHFDKPDKIERFFQRAIKKKWYRDEKIRIPPKTRRQLHEYQHSFNCV